MKSGLLSILVLAGMLIGFPALALDLHQARSSGQVGEQIDGYAAALQPSAEVNALVADVNAKRKQEYAKISAQKGQPVEVVAKLAAQEIINGLPAGNSYQGTDGGWKKR